MFKKGVITDEISQDLKTAVELAVRYNLDAIEIRSVWEKGPHELDNKEMDEIKKITADAGLKVCCIASPFYKCNIDNKNEIIQHHEILKKCIYLAQRLETSLIRGFTFWNKGHFEDYVDRIVSEFEKPVKMLEKENMTMVIEGEENVFSANAQKNRKIIEKINSPYVRVLWDPANELYDPKGVRPFPEGYEIIKPYIRHVHIKDAKIEKDGKVTETCVGEGQVDFHGQLKALINDYYTGYVVLETHYRKQHPISNELMAMPKGSAFSYMGYESSEECLINWRKIMDEIAG